MGAPLYLTFEKKKEGLRDVDGGSCWTSPLQRRTWGSFGQQADHEPAMHPQAAQGTELSAEMCPFPSFSQQH